MIEVYEIMYSIEMHFFWKGLFFCLFSHMKNINKKTFMTVDMLIGQTSLRHQAYIHHDFPRQTVQFMDIIDKY